MLCLIQERACYREVLPAEQKHSHSACTCWCSYSGHRVQDCKILMKIFSMKVPRGKWVGRISSASASTIVPSWIYMSLTVGISEFKNIVIVGETDVNLDRPH